MVEQPLPARTGVGHQGLRALQPVTYDLSRGKHRLLLHDRQFVCQQRTDRVEHPQLVAYGQFDIDAFDAVGIFAQPFQWYDHIFVDLEGVGVAGYRCGACAVQPESPARFGGHGDKTFGAARIG